MGSIQKNIAVTDSSTNPKSTNIFLDVRKLTLIFAILSWLALVFTGLTEQSFWHNETLSLQNSNPLKGLLLNAFIFNLYIYSWQQTQKQAGADFYGFLWRTFLTAILCTGIAIALTGVLVAIEDSPETFQSLVHSFIFQVEFGLLLFFLMIAYSKWRRIILYEKSKWVWYAWLVFEIGLFAATFTHFFHFETFNAYFYVIYGGFISLTFILSINLRWVPYLTYKQKLTSIPMLLLILGCLGYFVNSFIQYFSHDALVIDDISKSLFLISLFSFVGIYSLISLLAVIFNLPSASVFDSKFKEINEFQRINEALLGKSEQEIYEVLINNLIDMVRADAAWLEASQDKVFIAKNISRENALALKEVIQEKGFDNQQYKNFTNNYLFSKSHQKMAYNSILAIPIKSGESSIGSLVLLKNMQGAFDNMMITIVNTFVAQANVAIHNYKLMRGAGIGKIDKEGLEIAKKVQDRLIPGNQVLQEIKELEILAVADSAETVGGDFYDTHKVSDGKYAVLIADVAGKGITAAFSMAQMKGVFKSLAQVAPTPHEFMKGANAALSGVLEKNIFITASYFLIDTNESKVYFSRAGHCPTLYYSNRKQSVEYFHNQGLGLGILTDEKFERFIQVSDFYYQTDDLLVFYTDGIVEAKNENSGEEFGYDRLQAYIEQHHHETLDEISEGLIISIQEFIQDKKLQDDYTLLLIRLK